MVEQGIHESSVGIARCWMDNETGRLVDDQQMLVLEDDPQRDVLRLVVSRRWLRNRKQERFASTDLQRRVANGRGPEGFQGAATDQSLQPFPGQGWDGIGKRAVQPPPLMARLKRDVDDLVAPHALDMGIGFANSMRRKLAPC